MKDRTAISPNCTIQLRSGAFCDAPRMEDMPYPICARHAIKIHIAVYESAGEMIRGEVPEAAVDAFAAQQDARKERLKEQSQVYYVRIGDRIKIGYTQNMKQRMSELRVPLENVLATEPGDAALERERHLAFAAGRHGRLEEFNPSRELLAHIQSVVAKNGPPRITSYKTAA